MIIMAIIIERETEIREKTIAITTTGHRLDGKKEQQHQPDNR